MLNVRERPTTSWGSSSSSTCGSSVRGARRGHTTSEHVGKQREALTSPGLIGADVRTFGLDWASVRLTGRVTAEHDSNAPSPDDDATNSSAGVTAAQRRPATAADGTNEILVLMVYLHHAARHTTNIVAKCDIPPPTCPYRRS